MQNGVTRYQERSGTSSSECAVRETNHSNNSWPTVLFICLSCLCRLSCQFSSLLFLQPRVTFIGSISHLVSFSRFSISTFFPLLLSSLSNLAYDLLCSLIIVRETIYETSWLCATVILTAAQAHSMELSCCDVIGRTIAILLLRVNILTTKICSINLSSYIATSHFCYYTYYYKFYWNTSFLNL